MDDVAPVERARRDETEHRERLHEAAAHAEETIERAEKRLEAVDRRVQAREERAKEALPADAK